MSLNLNWLKSYDTNEKIHKNAKNTKIAKNTTQIRFFFTKSQKDENENIFVLCHNF